MDKSELDFLLECQEELASMKEIISAMEMRLDVIQKKLAEEAAAAPVEEAPLEVPAEEPAGGDEVDFTGVEIGVADAVANIAPVDIPAPDSQEPIEIEPIAIEPIASIPEDPFIPEPTVLETPKQENPVPDDTANMPWRKDNPGMLVKNIRSGISLLDRAQFIGTLFKEDFALYDSTIAALNNMTSLDEAVAYIKANFPQWNLGSDVVYRFMMAIRKKLG